MIKNWELKIFSLCLAIALSYAVTSERNSVSLIVPLEVKNLPEGRILVSPDDRSVQLTIQGPSFLIGPVASSPPAVKIKLPAGIGERVAIPLNASDIALPPGVQVLGFKPAEVEFVFEPLERRDVRIEVPRIGQLARHLVLEGIDIRPNMATVVGPRSQVQAVRVVETDPIDLREINAPSVMELNVRLPGNQTKVSVLRVTAQVQVKTVPRERTFEGRPVEIRSTIGMAGIKIDPLTVRVVVAGPPNVVGELEPGAILPFVRIRTLPDNASARVGVDVELPPDVRLVRVEPSEVTLVKGAPPSAPARTKATKP